MIFTHRQTFWDDTSAFQLRVRASTTADEMWAKVEEAALAAGLEVGARSASRLGEKRQYAIPGYPRSFGVALETQSPEGAQVLVSPAYDQGTDAREADALADFALALCNCPIAFLGRTFGYVSADGYLTPEEVNGPLEFIDWLQYYGPEVTERIGPERLKAISVFQMTPTTGGGTFIRVTRHPYQAFSRATLARQLGITLRPMRWWHPQTQTWSNRDWP